MIKSRPKRVTLKTDAVCLTRSETRATKSLSVSNVSDSTYNICYFVNYLVFNIIVKQKTKTKQKYKEKDELNINIYQFIQLHEMITINKYNELSLSDNKKGEKKKRKKENITQNITKLNEEIKKIKTRKDIVIK